MARVSPLHAGNRAVGNRAACDRCHAKKVKCARVMDDARCRNCQKGGTLCTYSPPLEGGRPRKRKHQNNSISEAPPPPPPSEYNHHNYHQADHFHATSCPPPQFYNVHHGGHVQEIPAEDASPWEDSTDIAEMSYANNTQYYRGMFWRPWTDDAMPSPEDGNVAPEIFGDPHAAAQNQHHGGGVFGTDSPSQHTSSNGYSTPVLDADEVSERLATLHKQLLSVKPVSSSLVAADVHQEQQQQQHLLDANRALVSTLESLQPALSLAHDILDSILSSGQIIQHLAETSMLRGCHDDESRTMLAVVMPAMLALDLYREVIQMITNEVQSRDPVMAMSSWSGHSTRSGFSPTEDSRSPGLSPAWSAGSAKDLQMFLNLSTLNYYLIRMGQKTEAGEFALSIQDGGEGGSGFISLSIRQLASTVRNLRTLTAHAMQGVLYSHGNS